MFPSDSSTVFQLTVPDSLVTLVTQDFLEKFVFYTETSFKMSFVGVSKDVLRRVGLL